MIVEPASLRGAHLSETSPATVVRQRRAWRAPSVTIVDLAELTLGGAFTGADDTITGS